MPWSLTLTVRRILVDKYDRHRSAVIHVLRTSPGQIHIAFDGWRSRNKRALYGITCSYLDQHYYIKKLVLGMPELQTSHTGENIAKEIIDTLLSYKIINKIGYFTLDNASNNNTAMAANVSYKRVAHISEWRTSHHHTTIILNSKTTTLRINYNYIGNK